MVTQQTATARSATTRSTATQPTAVPGGASARAPRTTPSPVAARILEAGTRLFYASGIRAVSADRIIADAGITKVTFYRHFPTKDDLVVAYLQVVAAAERAAVDAVRTAHPGDPGAALRELADVIGRGTCEPGFRGCAFINAAAEYADPEHPVRQVVAAHRAWFLDAVRALLAELGVDGPDEVAEELLMLRDGAMVAGYLGDPESAARALARAAAAVVAGRSPRQV